jgi:hypothetical protein
MQGFEVNFKKLSSRLLMIGLAAAMTSGQAQKGSAQSADGECVCLTRLAPGEEQVGSITFARGRVEVSRRDGFAQAVDGLPLEVGDSVMIGPASSATLSVGQGCAFSAGPNQQVWLMQQGSLLCMRSDVAQAAQSDHEEPQPEWTQFSLPAVLVLTFNGAVLALSLGDEGDGPVSD